MRAPRRAPGAAPAQADGGGHTGAPLNSPEGEETRNFSATQVVESPGSPHACASAVTATPPGAPVCTRCRRRDGERCRALREAQLHAFPGRRSAPGVGRLSAESAPRGLTRRLLYFKRSFSLEELKTHVSLSHHFPTQTRPTAFDLGFFGWCLFQTELGIFSVPETMGGGPRWVCTPFSGVSLFAKPVFTTQCGEWVRSHAERVTTCSHRFERFLRRPGKSPSTLLPAGRFPHWGWAGTCAADGVGFGHDDATGRTRLLECRGQFSGNAVQVDISLSWREWTTYAFYLN